MKKKLGFWQFWGRVFRGPWFYLLLFATFSFVLVFSWRGWLRRQILWEVVR